MITHGITLTVKGPGAHAMRGAAAAMSVLAPANFEFDAGVSPLVIRAGGEEWTPVVSAVCIALGLLMASDADSKNTSVEVIAGPDATITADIALLISGRDPIHNAVPTEML